VRNKAIYLALGVQTGNANASAGTLTSW